MACVNQTRPHCVNQMGKTQSNDLAERHGRGTAGEWQGNGMGTAWERYGMCGSALVMSNGASHEVSTVVLNAEVLETPYRSVWRSGTCPKHFTMQTLCTDNPERFSRAVY
jgi:hypothetical protein